MSGLLSTGLLFSDRIEALLDGRVAPSGVTLAIQCVEAQRLFNSILKEKAFDVAELSLGSHIAAVAAGRRDYVALPVFLSRSFRHANLFVRTDRIRAPEDLAGARIGLLDFQQTAALWLRGLLADDHGVARESVRWVTAGLHAPVLTDRMAMSLPPGINVERSGETLDALLRAGEIDAVISPTAPRCLADPDVPVSRMWPDFVTEQARWWQRTAIFPIMHVLVVRRALVEAEPALSDALFNAFDEARSLALHDLAVRDFPKVALPNLYAAAQVALTEFARDMWSYGLENNRAVLETMLRYAEADRLTKIRLTPEQLFA